LRGRLFQTVGAEYLKTFDTLAYFVKGGHFRRLIRLAVRRLPRG